MDYFVLYIHASTVSDIASLYELDFKGFLTSGELVKWRALPKENFIRQTFQRWSACETDFVVKKEK